MVFESRKFAIKWGLILVLITIAFLTQTTFKDLVPSIDDYTDLEIPVVIFDINLVIIAWIIFAIGLVLFILGVLDLPPFNM